MNHSFEYIDIILLAMIAGFIFLRLRGILGKRTGFEGKAPSQFEKVLNNVQKDNKVVNKINFDQQAQEESKKRNFRLVGEVDIEEVNNFRDKHLFHVRHEGSRDIVELNISHPFAKAISEEEISNMTPSEIRALFARFMASYARARTSLLGSGLSMPQVLFEQAEFDWSEYTVKFVEEMTNKGDSN